MKTSSALSYFGSIGALAPELASHLDECKHVTLPFVGSAAIIPHLKARAILANDLHDAAITFYRVLSGLAGEDAREDLINRCEHTLSHPANLRIAHHLLDDLSENSVDLAWAMWATCWIGRKGMGGTKYYGRISVRRNCEGGGNASRIQSAAKDLRAWAEHFKKCEWDCQDFRVILQKAHDKEGLGICCDPPWVEAGHNYLHSFCEQDHRDLAILLERFEKTRVVLRYDDHPLVRSLYPTSKWRIIEASARTQAYKMKNELWLINHER